MCPGISTSPRDPVAYLLPLGLLTALCALTVVSRITRAVREGGAPSPSAKFVTLVCSTLILVIVCNAYLERSHLDQLLNSGVFVTLVAFELVYLAGRILDVEADAALVGLKALVVVAVLYLSSRRLANFNPGHRALTTADDFALRNKETGSPLYQLGPKGDMCNFLFTDMLKPDTKPSGMSDQWHPYRLTSSAIDADGEWFCKGDSGSSSQTMRLLIALPLVFYVLVLWASQGATGITSLGDSITRFIEPLGAGFRKRFGFTRGIRAAAPGGRAYSRIRVGV